MNYLILLRHGQSQWNFENRFTGCTDVELTESGISEAEEAGKLIDKLEIHIDRVYTSNLNRAIKTAIIAMKQTKQTHLYKEENLIFEKNEALNERDYGNLVGLNKNETKKKFGADQVHLWRRSFSIRPPDGESLEDVVTRVTPYFQNKINNEILENKNILISAHGNSLRALFFILGMYDKDKISTVEIPTGKPLLLKFERGKLKDYNYIN